MIKRIRNRWLILCFRDWLRKIPETPEPIYDYDFDQGA